ncbi:MAG: hypothetical protein M4579_001913 [Chaenotheca gracillima]|nr:MAG: hypothetical protein M4579_001913 [Chaenotheca gracillima]
MKLYSGLLFAACLKLAIGSPSASVYSFNPRTSSTELQAPTIDDETATLILSSHLGTSERYSLGGLDDVQIRQIGELGGRQTPLLQKSGSESSKLVVLVEGVENADVFSASQSPSFHIDHTVSSNGANLFSKQLALDGSCGGRFEVTENLSIDVSDAAISAETACCPPLMELFTGARISTSDDFDLLDDILNKDLSSRCNQPTTLVVYFSALKSIAERDGASSSSYKGAAQRLRQSLNSLGRYSESGGMSSLVILSSQSAPSVSEHQKREVRRQQDGEEAPLSNPASAISSSASEVPTPNPSKSPSSPKKKGIYIPICHPSLEACNSATNSCTGHGTCSLKYSTSNPNDAQDKSNCFSCDCSKLPEGQTKGKKNTQWGGTACQKKDVSAPFFLLAGITIFLVGAMSWGIGLLFSIGQEPLPSVIGAGVAGPRAQR